MSVEVSVKWKKSRRVMLGVACTCGVTFGSMPRIIYCNDQRLKQIQDTQTTTSAKKNSTHVPKEGQNKVPETQLGTPDNHSSNL